MRYWEFFDKVHTPKSIWQDREASSGSNCFSNLRNVSCFDGMLHSSGRNRPSNMKKKHSKKHKKHIIKGVICSFVCVFHLIYLSANVDEMFRCSWSNRVRLDELVLKLERHKTSRTQFWMNALKNWFFQNTDVDIESCVWKEKKL